MQRVSRPSPNRRFGLLPAVVALLSVLASGSARAEPSWWTGSMKDMRVAAQQGGKWMVLYFENEAAINCRKMNDTTWPEIQPHQVDTYLWGRLRPETDQTFFDHYQVLQLPELVVTDADGKERARLRGFVEPATLVDLLKNAYNPSAAGAGPVVMLRDGTIMAKDAYEKALAENSAQFEQQSYFWYESFDAVGSLESQPERFKILVQTALTIAPSDGKYGSGALAVDATIRSGTVFTTDPSSRLLINLNRGKDKSLDQVEIVRGRLRVSMALRVQRLVQDGRRDVMALIVVPKGKPFDAPEAKRYTQNLKPDDFAWQDKYIDSDPINFKEVDAYLDLWVMKPTEGYFVDDLRVEIVGENAAAPGEGPGGPKRMPDPVGLLGRLLRGSGDAVFALMDKNRDGRIARAEPVGYEVDLIGVVYGGFDTVDLNKDGMIDEQEWQQKKTASAVLPPK